STAGAIRISTMLQGMPQWVIDGVLIHEMAHLKYRGHGRQFQEISGRYPRMADADAFLDGVSFAQQRDQDKMITEACDYDSSSNPRARSCCRSSARLDDCSSAEARRLT